MEFLESYPSKPLDLYVKSFWSISGKLKPDQSLISRDLPNGDIYVVFNLGDQILHCNGKSVTNSYSNSIIRGQQKQAIIFEQQGNLDLFGISFYPWGLSPFLKIPMDEFTDKIIPINGLFDSHLEEKFVHKNFRDRIAILEQILLKKLSDVPFSLPFVKHSASEIINRHGVVSIREMANNLNISIRHFERCFMDITGLGPKQFARLVKINSVINKLKTTDNANWMDFVHDYRFHDQAHFSREFKLVTGLPPTHFVQTKDSIYHRYIPHFKQI